MMKRQGLNKSNVFNTPDESFLHSIGQAYSYNLVRHVESITINENDELFPSSLDDWFNEFISEQKNEIDRRQLVQEILRSRRFLSKVINSRVALVLVGIMICTSIISLNSSAFRVNMYELYIKVSKNFSEVSYDSSIKNVELLDELPDNWSGYYMSVLPLNYEFKVLLESNGGKYIICSNDSKDELVFIQGTLNMNVLIDSEDSITYAVDINGLEGLIYEKPDLVTLFWNDNLTCFYLIGNIEKEIMVKIASSLNYKK